MRLYVSHGNGFAADGYYPFWRYLENDFELIVFDFRNHGQSSVADNHHYAQFTQDIDYIFREVSDALGLKASIGVFHSMSARATMKHVIEHKWVWDGLILFDPPNVPPPDHPLYPAMEVFEKKLESWAKKRQTRFRHSNELAQDYLKNKGHARWTQGSHELMAQSVLRSNAVSKQFELVCQPALEASIYAEALSLNLWPPADAFAGPVKLIGANPKMKGVPPTALANRALHEEMGYAYTSVPNTGHMLQLEAPQTCANEVIKFLNEYDLHI